MTDRWFFPGIPVSSTNKTDRHDISEILLKVAANTIPPPFINWVLVMVLMTQPTKLSNACLSMGLLCYICHNVGILTTDDDDDVCFVLYQLTSVTLIRYDMVVNEHEKLSKITLRHRLK